MKKIATYLSEIKLCGITTRTNNAELFQQSTSPNKIEVLMHQYFSQDLAKKIINRKNPGVTLCVYTNYENDFTGDYTYFIGEEVTDFGEIDSTLQTLIISAQDYMKFTNQPGPMPNVCVDMWQNIWKMNSNELGGERSYIADFEVYDERCTDLSNAVLDIYLGIKN